MAIILGREFWQSSKPEGGWVSRHLVEQSRTSSPRLRAWGSSYTTETSFSCEPGFWWLFVLAEGLPEEVMEQGARP